MKTTVEITDGLLREAKRIAAKEGTSVRALLEEGLRRALEERRQKPPFQLRDASHRQGGLQPDVQEGSWVRVRDLIYEGRGS